MGRYIVKIPDHENVYYMEWSTVVDAPVTPGMTLDDFKAYYRERHGSESMKELPERLERVEEKGVSSFNDDSAEALMRFNRAGKDETSLSVGQILDYYCRQNTEVLPTGRTWDCEANDWVPEVATPSAAA